MRYYVFFVHNTSEQPERMLEAHIVIERKKKPTTWQQMQYVYADIRLATGAKNMLIYAIIAEGDLQKYGKRNCLYANRDQTYMAKRGIRHEQTFERVAS